MPTEHPGPDRLNPMALPPATFGRFLLLVVTTLVGSVHIYAWLAGHLAVVSAAPAGCAAIARDVTGVVAPDRLIDWYSGCLRHASLREAALVGIALAGFLLLTITGYLIAPRLIRRGRVRIDHPLVPPAARDVVAVALPEHAPPLDIYFDLGSRTGGGFAFGRVGRYGIVLDVRAAQETVHAGRLQAILAHEIAHIRNRDVDLTYLAITVWWAFLPAAVVPLFVVAVREPALLAGFAWRIGGLLLLLFVIRAGVLRIREHYADVTAAPTRAAEKHLADVLVSRPEPARWSRLRWYHPPTAARVAVIHGDHRLFRLDASAAGALGVLVGLAYTPAYYLTTLLLPGSVFLRGWLCGLLFGCLGAAVMTGSVWRATLWDLAGGRPAPLAPAVFALAGGILTGQLFVPDLAEVGGWRVVAGASPMLGGTTAALLIVGCFAHLAWSRFAARQWLAVTGHPVRAYRFAVAQSAVTAGAWLAFWFQLLDLLRGPGRGVGGLAVVLASAALNPVLMLTLVWGFAYPLLAWRTERGRYPFWRAPGGPQPGSADLVVTPLTAAAVAAAGTVFAYGLVVVPIYPRLSAALEDVRAAPAPGPALAHVVLLLFGPALLIAAAGAFALGGWCGGRGRPAVALAAGGCFALPAAVGLLLTVLMHVSRASPQSRSFRDLVAGLAGATVPDGPAYPALGLMTTLLYAVLVVVAVPAALLGNVVLSRDHLGRHVRRPAWGGQLLRGLPLIVCAAAVGRLGISEWSTPQTSTVRGDFDVPRMERIVTDGTVGSLPREVACARLVSTAGSPVRAGDVVAGDFAVRLASAATLALSSDDATLRAFGEGAREALQLREVQRSAAGISAALHYCAATTNGRP